MMSRLITYDKNQKRYFHKFSTDGFDTLFQKVCAKLYALEDLEEELGCSLDVVFKALKTNIWNDKTKRQEWVVLDYSNHEFVLKTTKELYIDDCKSILLLKDYKKTWWLVSDKEKEE